LPEPVGCAHERDARADGWPEEELATRRGAADARLPHGPLATERADAAQDGPSPDAARDRFTELVARHRRGAERLADGFDRRVHLLLGHAEIGETLRVFVTPPSGAQRREPPPVFARGEQMHGAADPVRLHEHARLPERRVEVTLAEVRDAQAERELRARHHLRVDTAYLGDDVHELRARCGLAEMVPREAPRDDAAPGELADGHS